MNTVDRTLTIQPDLESVRALGPWLHSCLTDPGCAPDLNSSVGEIELALHELAVNIIEHSLNETGPAFSIALACGPDSLTAIVTDAGRPFSAADWPAPPTEPQVGGYGLMILEQLAETVAVERIGNTNQWTVVFS